MKRSIIFFVILLFSIGGFAVFRFPEAKIESVELVNGKIEVVKSQVESIFTSDLVYRPTSEVQFQEAPKIVWKEIYAAKDGAIVLEKIIQGKIIPAQDERWEFPKE